MDEWKIRVAEEYAELKERYEKLKAYNTKWEVKEHITKPCCNPWWSDEVKAAFKETEGIRYSDCYEVYGLRRTGCVGCPFNSTVNADLKVMQKYEPRLFKACMNVFGRSYKLMDEFSIRKMRVLDGLEV